MSSLSQIQLPNGDLYDLKDSEARSNLRYSIVEPTITNGEVALVDRAINVIPQSSAFSSFLLPAGISGKARDMIVRFNPPEDTYIGFSSVDADGDVVQWLKVDPSGTFPDCENILGITEVGQGVFAASDLLYSYRIEKIIRGIETRLLYVNYGDSGSDSSDSGGPE